MKKPEFRKGQRVLADGVEVELVRRSVMPSIWVVVAPNFIREDLLRHKPRREMGLPRKGAKR